MNRYAYARGNPIALSDPGGNAAEDKLGGLVQLQGALIVAMSQAGSDAKRDALQQQLKQAGSEIAIEVGRLSRQDAVERELAWSFLRCGRERVNSTLCSLQYLTSASLTNSLPLSESIPRSANGIASRMPSSPSTTSEASRTSNGRHSVQPLEMSVIVSV